MSALVFERVTKPAFASVCAWCRDAIGLGAAIVYVQHDQSDDELACGRACAENLIDNERDRVAAQRAKRLPAIGKALLREAA